ncbi:MAG: NAD(P)/FAD-dependent oxidoreductase [Bacilli bacterium]
MLKITNIKVDLEHTIDDVLNQCKKILKTNNFTDYSIDKKSLDARKSKMFYVYSLVVNVENEHKYLKHKNVSIAKKYKLKPVNVGLKTRPIIVGSGPCGLFAALMLALCGTKPIIIERGSDVDTRVETIAKFFKTGILDLNTNIQFGEGGAGTFSDGKLTTQIKNPRSKIVLEYLVKFGANESIMYDAKPHIGSDVLIKILKNMRKFLINNGTTFLFNHQLTNINIVDNKLKNIEVVYNSKTLSFATNHLFLAIGHSSRDTFKLIYERGLDIVAKPFAVGVRIEHPQAMINKIQYGNNVIDAADYKLTANLSNGRGAYTFCMCPGGVVVAATSEENCVVTNGMSYSKRDLENANSALLINVNPSDFSSTHALGGMEFQENLERAAYKLGGSNYFAPVQTVKDFLNKKVTTSFKGVTPTYKPGVTMANLHDILPNFVSESLMEGIISINKKFDGFNLDDAILTGIESRTSSPIRILRDANCFSNIKGIIPCGEGAGYAGGIMSAAIDGIKVVEKALNIELVIAE